MLAKVGIALLKLLWLTVKSPPLKKKEPRALGGGRFDPHASMAHKGHVIKHQRERKKKHALDMAIARPNPILHGPSLSNLGEIYLPRFFAIPNIYPPSYVDFAWFALHQLKTVIALMIIWSSGMQF